jgi:hypothetical protein
MRPGRIDRRPIIEPGLTLLGLRCPMREAWAVARMPEAPLDLQSW